MVNTKMGGWLISILFFFFLVCTASVSAERDFYGGMWLHNDTGIDVTWNDTYQLIQFTNSTNLIGFDFVDNSKLKNTNGVGFYQVIWGAVGTGTNNHIYHGAIFVNEIKQINTIGHSIGTGNDEVRIDGFGFIYLTKYDNVTLRGRDVGDTTSAKAIMANVNLVKLNDDANDRAFWLQLFLILIPLLLIYLGNVTEDKYFIIISGFIFAIYAIYIATNGLPNLDNSFITTSLIIIMGGLGFYLMGKFGYDLATESGF